MSANITRDPHKPKKKFILTTFLSIVLGSSLKIAKIKNRSGGNRCCLFSSLRNGKAGKAEPPKKRALMNCWHARNCVNREKWTAKKKKQKKRAREKSEDVRGAVEDSEQTSGTQCCILKWIKWRHGNAWSNEIDTTRNHFRPNKPVGFNKPT